MLKLLGIEEVFARPATQYHHAPLGRGR
jgi:hypothetical protein